jgi:hypothetical protein
MPGVEKAIFVYSKDVTLGVSDDEVLKSLISSGCASSDSPLHSPLDTWKAGLLEVFVVPALCFRPWLKM